MNKLSTKTKNDNTKKTKRRAYESLLLLLLTISLFITATFAWFTDSAFSKGNKVFAGNLYIDILADAEDLEAKYNSAFEDWKTLSGNENKEIDDYLIEELDCEPYTRKYLNPNYDDGQPEDENNKQYIEERYYITTGTEAGGINLYNMEPGQVRKLDVKYVNTGDLAFKAGGALKFDYDDTTGEPKSYTGLETLNQQKEQEAEIYRNTYAVGNGNGTIITTDVFYIGGGEYDEIISMEDGTKIEDGFTASVYFENKNNINDQISIKELSNFPIYDIKLSSLKGSYEMSQNEINQFKQQYIGGNYFEKVQNNNPGGSGKEHIFWYMLNYCYDFTFRGKDPNSEDLVYVYKDMLTKTIPPTSDIDPKLIALGKDTNDNDYSYYSAVIEDIPDDEYQYRFKKLVNLQAEKDAYGNPKKYSGSDFGGEVPSGYVSSDNGATYYKDEGGHLEEVLEVYVIPSANKAKSNASVDKVEEGSKQPQVLPEIIDEKEIKKDDSLTIDHEIFTNKDKLHDEYYFGNLEQFTFLMNNGAIATKDYKLAEGTTLEIIGEKITKNETVDPEAKYMYLYNDENKSLYEDYQRYLGNVGGYCLPKDAVTKDGTVTLPNKDGINVLVYDEEGNPTPQKYSEMGECEIYLYMPTTADSRYQNASISLSIGATATQVEYEMDDTGYMLYDKFEYKNNTEKTETEYKVGDEIQLKDLTDYSFKVLNVDDNTGNLTVMPIELNVVASVANDYGYAYSDPKINFDYITKVESMSCYDYKSSSLNTNVVNKFNNKFSNILSNYVENVTSLDQYRFSYAHSDSLLLFANNNQLNMAYRFEDSDLVLARSHVNHIQGINLPARSLCLDDIFSYLDATKKDYSANNIADIFKSEKQLFKSVIGDKAPSSRTVTYALMDVSSPSTYICVKTDGSFVDYTVLENSSGSIQCMPIITLKGTMLKDIVVNSSIDDDIDDGFEDIELNYSQDQLGNGTAIELPKPKNAVGNVTYKLELNDEIKQYFTLNNGSIEISNNTPNGDYDLLIKATDENGKEYTATYRISISDKVVPVAGDLLTNINGKGNRRSIRVLDVDNENDTATLFIPSPMDSSYNYFDSSYKPIKTKQINDKFIADYYPSLNQQFVTARGKLFLSNFFGTESLGTDSTNYNHLSHINNKIKCYTMEKYDSSKALSKDDILYENNDQKYIFKYQFEETDSTDVQIKPLTIKDIYDSYYDSPGETLTKKQVSDFVKNTYDDFLFEEKSFWLMDLCPTDNTDVLYGYYFDIYGNIDKSIIGDGSNPDELEHGSACVVTIDLDLLNGLTSFDIPEGSNISENTFEFNRTKYAFFGDFDDDDTFQYFFNKFDESCLDKISYRKMSSRNLINKTEYVDNDNYFEFFKKEIIDNKIADEVVLQLRGADITLINKFNSLANEYNLHLIYSGTVLNDSALDSIGSNNSFYGNTLTSYINKISDTIDDFCNNPDTTINDNQLDILIQNVYGNDSKWISLLDSLQNEISKRTFKHNGKTVTVVLNKDKFYTRNSFYNSDADKDLLKTIDLIIQFDEFYSDGLYPLSEIYDLYSENFLNIPEPPIIFVNLFGYQHDLYNNNIYKVIEADYENISKDISNEFKNYFENKEHSAIKKYDYSINYRNNSK